MQRITINDVGDGVLDVPQLAVANGTSNAHPYGVWIGTDCDRDKPSASQKRGTSPYTGEALKGNSSPQETIAPPFSGLIPPGYANMKKKEGLCMELSFGKNLANLRTQRGLSQSELAQQLHVSRQAVSNWERDKSYPDLDTLRQLTLVLEVSADTLLAGKRGDGLSIPLWPTLAVLAAFP